MQTHINEVEAGTTGTVTPENGVKNPSSQPDNGKTGKSKKRRCKKSRVVIDCDPSKLVFSEKARQVIRRIYAARHIAILDLRAPLNEFIEKEFENYIRENHASFFKFE